MSSTPPEFDKTPPVSQHCACFSGLTDAQTRLLKLVGCLEALDFPVVDAIAALEAPGADHDVELVSSMRRLQREFVSAIGHINFKVWPAGRAR